MYRVSTNLILKTLMSLFEHDLMNAQCQIKVTQQAEKWSNESKYSKLKKQ